MTPVTNQDNEETVRRIIEVNVFGTALITRLALPPLAAGGAIIDTASIWGRVAEPLFDAYVASKHAIIGLTKTWARELGARGIRVNAVCPGWVETEASMRSLERIASETDREKTELLKEITARQALDGLMVPEDMAATYLFLASELAANITGQSLGVDRGEVPW